MEIEETDLSLDSFELKPTGYWTSLCPPESQPQKVPFPSARWGHASFEWQNTWIIHGGIQSEAMEGSQERNGLWETSLEELSLMKPGDPSTWRLVPSENGKEILKMESHSAVVIGDEAFIFGGNLEETPQNSVWKFSFTSKKWSRCPSKSLDQPSARDSHVSFELSGRFLCVFGGIEGRRDLIFDDLWLYDTVGCLWFEAKVPKGEKKPSPRESHSAVKIGDCIYVFGGEGNSVHRKFGRSKNYLNDFYRLRITSENGKDFQSRFESIVPCDGIVPKHRSMHGSCTILDQYVAVLGGEGYTEEEEKIFFKRISEDDPEYQKCETKVKGITKMRRKTHIQGTSFNDIWLFDILREKWIEVDARSTQFFTPSFGFSVTSFKNHMIVFGGFHDCIESKKDAQIKTHEYILRFTFDLKSENSSNLLHHPI